MDINTQIPGTTVSVVVKVGDTVLHKIEIDGKDLAVTGKCKCKVLTIGKKKRVEFCQEDEVVVEAGKGPLWIVRTFLNRLGL